MHVALVSDSKWLDEELGQFQSMVVGLIDEQVRVAQVVPERLDQTDSSAFGERVGWPESSWSLMRVFALSRLKPSLEKLGVGLVHATTARVWQGAVLLARRLETPLVCNISSREEVALASRLLRHAGAARVAFIAATTPLGEAVRDRVGPRTVVQVIPPGVHVISDDAAPAGTKPPETPPTEPTPPEQRPLCAVIAGNGECDSDYQALLNALPAIIRDYPQAQFFLDGQRQDQHQLWRWSRQLGILSNVSLVPRRLGHYELLLRADVLLQPQALGQSRGLTLQAMAHGIPVIARADAMLDYLVPDRTAWVVDLPEPAIWTHRIRRVLEEPHAAHKLGESAKAWIAAKHIAARQIEAMLALYRKMTGEAYKFRQTG